MKAFDRFLQRWRIRMARPFIAQGSRVLDIGCGDGALFQALGGQAHGIGIDSSLRCQNPPVGVQYIAGYFPQDLPDHEPFDIITLLAVLEHFTEDKQPQLAADCAKYLKPGGKVVITVPSPLVDPILHVLIFLRVMHADSFEQHYGFDARKTRQLFEGAGLRLLRHRKFELGLNNLYVFEKPVKSSLSES